MLNEKLKSYLNEDFYPFHMPGHKRNTEILKNAPYGMDITEIKGFDNLNNPKDLYNEMEKKCAKLYNTKYAIFSANGSTNGNLATIRAFSKKNKNALIARNCHKSVYNAAELSRLNVDYIYPETFSEYYTYIDPKKIEVALSKKNYGFVVITSPTYEGFVSDIKQISKICKKYNTKLILDQAHGSHFGFSDFLPENSAKYADATITSFHKNMSGLTQTAVVLINDENEEAEIRRNMSIFQSTSPSYILMESVDEMLENIKYWKEHFDNLEKNLNKIYSMKLKHLEIIDENNKDKSKIVISLKNTNIDGFEFRELLRERKIEIELASINHVILITTIFDKNKGFERLIKALKEIDEIIKKDYIKIDLEIPQPKKTLEIYECVEKNCKKIDIKNAVNKISGQYLYSYPPGIPVITPGEKIDENTINFLIKQKNSKVVLTDGRDEFDGNIKIIVD
ncbi:MAG: aminotransferase class I/II-fold pyridoxal phosphate-dependent enzyme [Peptoniphilaceae bacterium]|nr:aminotransferase class I/II-fold pyridoxal phosphate-dependent enzyme [Peptoniphilaceae bacterium]MDD7383244.1 aminotransferase class I/II-fold pyridoxal phosphate-dependent enzyme [Peptoniphilaceae bacterium]MDY3737610.1 aminotransferase class I/II-fold pyridoxal phosphate-dependent enzyme [Peptoniphilaceae bacterium]